MQFACDINRNRIKPGYSGERAICPVCEGELIGKCGEILIWHWQHSQSAVCDTWKENETEWHRQWKNKFPEDWQEVVIEKNEEKHRADVLTSGNVVIEFQNSSISSSTIKARENFYDKMIWVINAISFKNNFQLYSRVTSNLKQLDSYSNYGSEVARRELQDYLKDLKQHLEDLYKDLQRKFSEKEGAENKIRLLNELRHNLESFLSSIHKKWDEKQNYWEYKFDFVVQQWQEKNKAIYLAQWEKVTSLRKTQKVPISVIDEVNNLEEYIYNDQIHKVLPFERITPKDYLRFIAIKKETKYTLLPIIKEFNSAEELINFKYQVSKYDFIFDPTDLIKKRQLEVDEIEKLIQTEIIKFEELKINQLLDLGNLLSEIEGSLNKKITEIMLEVEELKVKIDTQGNFITKTEKSKTQELDDEEHERDRAKEEEKHRIMKKYKGQYEFNWKHERRSWSNASCKIYFDTGEDFLFYLEYSSQVRKISKLTFMNTYLNTA